MFGLLNKIVGDSNEKAVKKLQPLVDEINSLEEDFRKPLHSNLNQVLQGAVKTKKDGRSSRPKPTTGAHPARSGR